MSQTPVPFGMAGSAERLHAAFLSILPRLERHGRVYFRDVKSYERREDLIADMVALSWLWFLLLARQGRDATHFSSAQATFAARHVRSGRRVTGVDRAKDVLNPQAQRRHGFLVSALPETSTLSANPFAEALADNTVTPVPEQVAFRSDFPAWRRTRSERDRRILDALMLGERTFDVSRRFGLSPGRISQLRRDFMEDWGRFCGEASGDAATKAHSLPS